MADYLHQMREKGDYNPSTKILEHAYETLELMSALTGDQRYEEAYDLCGKGEPKNMCVVMDRMVEKGRQEGILEGRQEGILEGRQEGILEGRQEGENNILELIDRLIELGRTEDIFRMSRDREYLDILLNELKINRFHGGG